MQVSSADNNPKPKRFSKVNTGLLNTVLLVFIAVTLCVGIGYFAGYQMGKREGARLAVQKVTDFLNPLNAINDSPLFPGTTLGKVNSVSKNSVSVKQPNGDDKTIAITDKTRVTKDKSTLSLSDIKKDANVTVFTTGRDKDVTATRIVLR